MADLIQIRRDKGSVWQSVNPTLALAEIGIVLDDNGAMTNPIQFKVGNGSTAWNNLPMQNGSAINKIKVNGVELTIDGNRAVDVIVKASGSLGTDVSGSTVAFVDSTGVVRNSSVNIANTSGSSTSSLITQAAVSESIADVRKDIDLLSGSVSGSFAAVDERVTGIEENIENNYAKIDGSYDSMAVGVAKNLEGDQEVEDTFISRTAGGTAEIANGVAQILEVKGNSVVWNQLVKKVKQTETTLNGLTFYPQENGEVLITGVATEDTYASCNYYVGYHYKSVANHKAFVQIFGDATRTIKLYVPDNLQIQTNLGIVQWGTTGGSSILLIPKGYDCGQGVRLRFIVNDLTQMFGAGNEPSTVEEVEAWLAENIGPLEYYPYNAGTVLNNSMEGIETTGFNLLDPATGKAQILGAYDDASGNFYGITGTHGTITFKAADGTEETVTPDADGKFQLTVPGELTVANAGADCAVFFWRDGSKTEYEEYDKNVSYLDVKNIYGKLNGSGSLVQVFPDGMAGVNDAKDVLHVKDGKVVADRKIGVVDLGTLGWTYDTSSAYPYFQASANNTGIAQYDPANIANIICSKYVTRPASVDAGGANGIGAYSSGANNFVRVYESLYTSVDSFKTAMSGVKLYYELATPQHYTDLVYINSPHFTDNTPVVLPVTYTVNNWGIENILPKNTSESISTAPADLLCRYAIDAVAQLNAHSNQIEDLYEVKADKKGTYPGLIAGNLVDASGVGTEQQFVFRHTGGEEHVADKTQAVIQKYMGKSLVWNQLIRIPSSSATKTIGGVTFTDNRDGTYTVQTDEGGATQEVFFEGFALGPKVGGALIGHKVLLKGCPTGASSSTFYMRSLEAYDFGEGGIGIPQSTEYGWPRIYVKSGTIITTPIVFRPQFFDLTLMFGAGNEPATVEEFKAMFPQPYYAYNEGTIISNNVDSIETVGFNQWDEEWENGYIGVNDGGVDKPSSTTFRSKNYIPVLSGTTLYVNKGGYNASLTLAKYNAEKAYIGFESVYSNGTIKMPSDVAFIRFYLEPGASTSTYNHDICINISDPAKNGTYEPYEKHSIQIGLGEFQVKDSEGSVITVNGLKSAGSAYDEIDPVRKKYIKRLGVKVFDGTENWIFAASIEGRLTNVCFLQMGDDFGASRKESVGNAICSNYEQLVGYSSEGSLLSYFNTIPYSVGKQLTIKDSAYTTSEETWKSHLAELYAAGTPLVIYYELATPEEYDLVRSVPEVYPAFGVGTEAIEPSGVNEETGVPKTTPFRAVIFYSKDYISQLNNMPRDYISVGSMTSFYTELASKLGAAISKSISVSASFNSSDQKYDYVITISDISGSI